ncbi:MAG: hypothetical protein V4813_10035 [Gemmatimonadota bacterium]
MQQHVTPARVGVRPAVTGRTTTRVWRFAAATVFSALLIGCGKDTPTQETVPVIKDPTSPLLALGTAGNGAGLCLEPSVDAAGLTSGGTPLNCTSEDVDISIAKVSEYSVDGGTTFIPLGPTDRIACTQGQTIQVRTSADVENNAQERYDLGLWINPVPGNSALSDPGAQACLHFNLVKNAAGVSDLDGGDACGDVAAGALVSVSLETITLTCTDPDNNGSVEIDACAAWQNSVGQADRVCPTPGTANSFRYGTTPETKAKCRCEPLALPIDIRGKLRIAKVTVPAGDPTQFGFTTTGTGYTTPFNLSHGQTNESGALSAGTYTATEALPAGWELQTRACVLTGTSTPKTFATISNGVSVALGTGEDVTCTFTNRKLGSITIVKDAVPNAAQDFAFTTTGTGLSSFSLDDDADPTLPNTTTFNNLVPGSYSVTETGVAGWTLTNLVCSAGGTPAGAVANITLAAGASVTCTYTNTKDATLTIVKDADPNDAQDFAFTTTGTGAAGFTAGFSNDDDADGTLPNSRTFTFNGNQLGTKTVIEGAVSGWVLTNLVCSAGSVNIATRTASVTLAAGDAVTCTFTNTKAATLTIVKDAQPNDAQNFAFTGTGTGVAPFSLDDDADVTLPSSQTFVFDGTQLGAKTVTESVVSGWSLTNLVCSAGSVNLGTRTASVTLAAGDAVTCTFTNAKDATITIIKDAIPNAAQDFGFTNTGSGLPSSFSLDDDADVTLPSTTTFSIPAAQFGAKTVTETATTGWALTGLSCSSSGAGTSDSENLGTATASMTVAAGGVVTCTFTNQRLATLTLRKAITGNSATFNFDLTGPMQSPALPTSASITPASNSVATAANVNGIFIVPGAYTINEVNIPATWMLTDKGCVNATASGETATGVTFTAGYNQEIICTFVNNQAAGETTRTQGFWSTHTVITTAIWTGSALPAGTSLVSFTPVTGTADAKLCPADGTGSELNIAEVFGGFWANIAKKSVGGQRTDLEKFRMQMLQQYLAAVLNVHAFGTPLPAGYSLAGARTAYCGTDITAINNYKTILAGYNEAYDSGLFTPGASATPQASRSTANIPFWDNTYQKP